MSKIKDMTFYKIDNSIVSMSIYLESGISSKHNICSNKYLKYIDKIKDSLIGMEIFDQEGIDNKLMKLNIDSSLCMGISSAILKIASKEENVEVFEYINDIYAVPSVVIDVNNIKILVNDYLDVKPFLDFIDKCLWNIHFDDIKKISSKYNVDILHNKYKLIDINKFNTITSFFEAIDNTSHDALMIHANDEIIYDLAFSLEFDYVLLDKHSNFNRFLDIVNLLEL